MKIIFETYFYLSINRLTISVFQKHDQSKIYNKDFQFENNLGEIDYLTIEKFLEENIIKIEKITKNFVNEISLVIEHRESLQIGISMKINNDRNIIRQKDIDYLLNDAKQQIRKSYLDKSIIHMIVDNYFFDDMKHSFLPSEINCDNFSFDIKFICISNELIKSVEFLFQKHQVFINKIVCAKYVKEFFHNEKIDICSMSRDIDKGCNKNEIIIIPKTSKKKGIFERFFHLFN